MEQGIVWSYQISEKEKKIEMALKNGSDRRWGILSKKAILKKNVEKRKKIR